MSVKPGNWPVFYISGVVGDYFPRLRLSEHMETLCWGVTQASSTSQTGNGKVELGSTLATVADRVPDKYEENFDMETFFLNSRLYLRPKPNTLILSEYCPLITCKCCVHIAYTQLAPFHFIFVSKWRVKVLARKEVTK